MFEPWRRSESAFRAALSARKVALEGIALSVGIAAQGRSSIRPVAVTLPRRDADAFGEKLLLMVKRRGLYLRVSAHC